MTQLLEEVIARVRELPATEQDFIAALILEELEDEQRWEAAFAASQDKLGQMAAKVRSDIEAGNVRDGGFGDL